MLYNHYHYVILSSYLPSFCKKLIIKNGSKFKYIGKVFIKNYICLHPSKNNVLQDNVTIFAHGTVILGENSFIAQGTKIKVFKNGYFKCDENFISGKNADIDATGKVSIGKNVIFSDNVSIISHKHLFLLEHGLQKNEIKCNVTVDDHCWIGYGVILLPDSHIKKSSIVGAKSTVTAKSDLMEKSLVLGSPAKTIKNLEDGYF